MWNGKGSSEFRAIGEELARVMQQGLQSPADALQYPEVLGERPGKGVQGQWGQVWVTYLARVLSKQGVAIKQPSQWGEAEESIRAAFKKPIELRLWQLLAQYGITMIKKAFQLGDNGKVQVSTTGLNAQWKRLLQMELQKIKEKEKAVEESYLLFKVIREALRGLAGPQWAQEFTPEAIQAKWGSREHWQAVHSMDSVRPCTLPANIIPY
ncbi:hypothetical protein EV182_006282 [Spiromyces aspiralis]|uniref:Uncharacterized protein n=1 Tax=Spiromyces aspiralis TaxID=68401 RepID=A0ACC1HSR2_9FUNG|nr:hypothetical protein EV182_006282 [Spiromyces aspiralis]